jgi:hypothetical protein
MNRSTDRTPPGADATGLARTTGLARRDLVAGEEGMLSLVSLFVVLGFLVLFALLANVAKTVTQKLETQNGADSIAYSATTEMARGMNTLTAVNHLIGELTALVVLHHALGGDELDGLRSVTPTPRNVRTSLDLSYRIASIVTIGGVRPQTFQYQAVRQEVRTGAAIRDSRIRLKQVMVWAYVAHAVGGIFQQLGWIPYVGPVLRIIGITIAVCAMVFETKVYLEWLTLDLLELIARGLMPLKKGMQSAVVPGLHGLNRLVTLQTPWKMERLAEDVGQHNAAEGSLFPGFLKNPSYPLLGLPVRQEPVSLRQEAKSQLVRTSTPWIQYWRLPMLRFGEKALLLARFKVHYWQRTDEFTLTLTRRLKQGGGLLAVNPYILEGLDLDRIDKGQETWTQASGSREADRLFGVIGFAHRRKPKIAAGGIFRQSNPDGLVGYAQGMIYNANPQPRAGAATAGAGWQPVVGWDTLNWAGPVPEYPGAGPNGPDPTIPTVPEPRIRINWQTKLVPTTRLAESIPFQQGELGRVVRRTPWWFTPLSGTH